MKAELTPIHPYDPEVLADAREALVATPPGPLPAELQSPRCRPFVADLRAQAATGRVRPATRGLTLKVVFIDEAGDGHGRLGDLRLELVPGGGGELYPAAEMAGVLTDAAWDGALTAAFFHARECGFPVPPDADVRWTVRTLDRGQNFDEHTPQPLCPAVELTGRSAGVAFFLGLFALAQGENARGEWQARAIVERIVALATLPLPGGAALGTLGGEEEKKLVALRALPAHAPVIVVFPGAYPGGLRGGEPLVATTVADLAAALRARAAVAVAPDNVPEWRRAPGYVGGAAAVNELRGALVPGGLHVVTGPGGMGKTRRVLEAAEPLWRAGHFSGGRFWVDLYQRGDKAADLAAAEAIAIACGERPAEKLDDLRAQPIRLLAQKRALILLEGAETVPEREFEPLLACFPGQTVVWMTRRHADAGRLGVPPHAVLPLGDDDALALLLQAAGREKTWPPAAELPAWQAIATATERVPLFLRWAGEALHADYHTPAAAYLAELQHDPLGEIAQPDRRLETNAGRFLRRSLDRILPMAEFPELPAVARRLFAGLAAFHPAAGAPLDAWPLAAGLNPVVRNDHRQFAAARRALLHLGLVTAEGDAHFPVHALAGAAARALWRQTPAGDRRAVLDALCSGAAAEVGAEPPPGWFRDAAFISRRIAQGRHCEHWVAEQAAAAEVTAAFPEVWLDQRDGSPLARLRTAWVDFLEDHVTPQPLLALKDAGWSALRACFASLAAAHPDVPDYQSNLAASWDRIGDVRSARQDWPGAEQAYQECFRLAQQLAAAHPDVPDYQRDLALSWDRIGEARSARQDWPGAEQAYQEYLRLAQQLAAAHPDVPEFQCGRALSWARIGDVRSERQDWPGAEQANQECLRLAQQLAAAHPDLPDFQRNLALSWARIGDVRSERQDWPGAEQAYQECFRLAQQLAAAHPDVPDYQRNLAASWDRIGAVRSARQDWPEAEQAYQEYLRLAQQLAAAHPDVPDYQRNLALSWDRIGQVRSARQDWPEAEQAYQEYLRLAQQLAAAHPDVPKFQCDLALSLERIGQVRSARQDWPGAEQAYQEYLRLAQQLAAAHPDVPDYQRNLALSWARIGDVRSERQDWPGAEQAYQECFRLAQQLAAAHPDVPDFQRNLAVSWARIGEVAEAKEQWATAAEAWGKAGRNSAALVEAIPGVPKLEQTFQVHALRLAQVLARLGRADEAATAAREGLASVARLETALAAAGNEGTEKQRGIAQALRELAG